MNVAALRVILDQRAAFLVILIWGRSWSRMPDASD
ncbi:hypothetical protein CLOBOL_02810 [Enterocloster bolteae ATCC BAA-613]|uniref:Uncharacterized protein n=1 Tax=Enterocloster bolteae (strain ATCC BAA-613 / DSM 15670 / CCUG 46953 / JCM 12243 / WAL 16351) TaxID=411902 RepID=A8RQR9_ENTBW|nr:hypothetical protein CLOBOL_02810 [Enterocloster bolteae ATCC BAA-613]